MPAKASFLRPTRLVQSNSSHDARSRSSSSDDPRVHIGGVDLFAADDCCRRARSSGRSLGEGLRLFFTFLSDSSPIHPDFIARWHDKDARHPRVPSIGGAASPRPRGCQPFPCTKEVPKSRPSYQSPFREKTVRAGLPAAARPRRSAPALPRRTAAGRTCRPVPVRRRRDRQRTTLRG
jgi:hypothetical protein